MVCGKQRWLLRWLPPNRFGSRVFSLRCCNTRKVLRITSDKLQTVLFYWWWNLEFLPGGWRGQGIAANHFAKLLRSALTRGHVVGTWSRDKRLRVYVKDAWCRDWKQACTHSVIGSFQWCRENSLQEHCTRWTLKIEFISSLVCDTPNQTVFFFHASCEGTKLHSGYCYCNFMIQIVFTFAGFWSKWRFGQHCAAFTDYLRRSEICATHPNRSHYVSLCEGWTICHLMKELLQWVFLRSNIYH